MFDTNVYINQNTRSISRKNHVLFYFLYMNRAATCVEEAVESVGLIVHQLIRLGSPRFDTAMLTRSRSEGWQIRWAVALVCFSSTF